MASLLKPIKYTPPKIEAPKTPAPGMAPAQPYKAAAAPTALPQFDVLKGQATQRANAAGQQQEQALQRKFASLGNLNSGAAIKLQQQSAADINQQKEDVIQGLDAAQTQEIARLGEVEKGREFQSAETAMQRQAQQSQFDRSFAEQQRQSSFMEQLGLQEHELSKFNTMYNTALSAATSDAQGAIFNTMEALFPGSSSQFGGSGKKIAASEDKAMMSRLGGNSRGMGSIQDQSARTGKPRGPVDPGYGKGRF
jgi:hypothetical protein